LPRVIGFQQAPDQVKSCCVPLGSQFVLAGIAPRDNGKDNVRSLAAQEIALKITGVVSQLDSVQQRRDSNLRQSLNSVSAGRP